MVISKQEKIYDEEINFEVEYAEALDKLLWKCAYITDDGKIETRFEDRNGLIVACVRAHDLLKRNQ